MTINELLYDKVIILIDDEIPLTRDVKKYITYEDIRNRTKLIWLCCLKFNDKNSAIEMHWNYDLDKWDFEGIGILFYQNEKPKNVPLFDHAIWIQPIKTSHQYQPSLNVRMFNDKEWSKPKEAFMYEIPGILISKKNFTHFFRYVQYEKNQIEMLNLGYWNKIQKINEIINQYKIKYTKVIVNDLRKG